ncbi:MAG: cyclic nucleotide-binding domain-containing protein [Thermodesulfobacteriota bacterium]
MEQLFLCYIFKGLSESQFQLLSEITKEEHIPKGEVLIREDQKAEALFILKEGKVELLTSVNDSFELPIAILRNPGDCVGMSSFVAPYKYSLSARCVKDAQILIIKQTALEKLMQKDHKLGCIMMKNIAQHLLARLKETRQEMRIHFKTFFQSMHP